jgi:hypothetical protein
MTPCLPLREAQGKIAELEERVTAAEDQLKRVDLRAPKTGFVHQLDAHHLGLTQPRASAAKSVTSSLSHSVEGVSARCIARATSARGGGWPASIRSRSPAGCGKRSSRWERGRPNRHYRDRFGFDADAGSWGDAISVSSPMQRFFRSAYRGSNPGLSNTLSAPRG